MGGHCLRLGWVGGGGLGSFAGVGGGWSWGVVAESFEGVEGMYLLAY